MERPQDRLALIECFERETRAARVLDVWEWPVTLGRAMDNNVVLDDAFVAPHHARLTLGPAGRVQLQVLNTANGVRVDGRPHAAGATVDIPAAGAMLQLGANSLRLRLPAETLAPERPLPKRGSALLPLACGGALWLLALLVHGIGLDPGADASAWLPTLLGLPAAVASWCAMWALMSKLFQHRFDFAGHLRIALPWLLALEAISLAVPQLGATLGWPWLWQLTSPLGALGGALLIRAHLVHVLPHQVRALTAAVAAALLVGGGISLHLTHRSTDRYTRAPYMSTLPLPALHWASREPAASLVAEMAPLAASLARRVQKAREDDAEDDEEGGGD